MSNIDDVLLDDFKERELEILSLMAAGYSNAAIGEQLFITKETVRWYNKQIYSKLGTSRRTEAIAKSRRLGLITDAKSDTTTAGQTERKDNLPTISTPFLGRDSEIARITDLLSQPHTPVITVLGPGGMGKTRLAIELGHKLRDQFADGVYLFELAALTQSDTIVNTALQALRLSSKGDTDPKETLFDHCREKKLLLIFDNFEHLLDGATLVDALIKSAPDVRVLVTSRERLNLYGELVYELSGLQKKGDALFIASAQTLQADFQVREGEQADLQRIVTLVGGLPLGIILAAAWVDALTVAEIAEEISQDLDMLTTEMRNVPERQRSMRTVLSASWQKLGRREQVACMKLGIFKGGFGRGAASKITGTSLPILQKLQHKSFVQRVAERRYDLHPLIRQFALERLEESGQLAETHQRHLTFYHKHISEMLLALDYGDYVHPLDQVELEHENVRLALDWGFTYADGSEAASLVLAMYRFWRLRSYLQEGNHYTALAIKCEPEGSVRARLLVKQTNFLQHLGQHESAETTAREALAFAKTVKEDDLQLEAIQALLGVFQGQGTYDKMVEFANRSIALCKNTGQRRFLAGALNYLAYAHNALGNQELAVDAIRQALQLSREQEDDALVAVYTYNLGLYLMGSLHKLTEARSLIEESLTLKRLIGDRAGTISRLCVLSQLATSEGQFQQASDHLAEAQAISEVVDLPQRKMALLSSFAFFYERQAIWDEALQNYKALLDLARENDHVYYILNGHLILSRLYLQTKLPHQAKHHLQQSIQFALRMHRRDTYNHCLLISSDYFRLLDSFRKSAELYFQHLVEGQVEFLWVDYAETLLTALQHHFTPEEWTTRQNEVPQNDTESLLQDLLHEFESQ